MSVIHEDLEPGVINLDLLKKCVKEQGPKAEAGNLAAKDGIVLEEVEVIRLEFLNILKIDHLWMMTALVKLQIGNNIIEKIENLHSLVNLKELDLSFNNIPVIENLDALVKLEILTLFANRITKLENMENLKNLMIFSIGNNEIEDWQNVLYLRKFRQLRSLNMAGNPCCANEDFQAYIFAFLPLLVYNEYKMIKSTEREEACSTYFKVLEKLEEQDAVENAVREEEEKEAEDVEFYSVAFIEYLNKDQLFKSLFAKDEPGQALLLIGNDAMEIYYEYESQFALLIAQLFALGQEQHVIRQKELEAFYDCVNKAKEANQEQCQQWMEEFLDFKTTIFIETKDILEIMEEAAEEELEEAVDRMQTLTDSFYDRCDDTWQQHMNAEMLLFEQIDEINGNFERNLTDVVNVFIEGAQGLFVQCRNLEVRFNEQISDCANNYLTHLTVDGPELVISELRSIMVDKDSLGNALSASHDMHMQLIDSREDQLVSRIRGWAKEFCENIHKEEVKRDRACVMEINHFLDIQRDEFDDLQGMSGNTARSGI